MPQSQDRKQLRSEELPEFPITGPFGGVQSELSLTQIEPFGFQDTKNIIFRKGTGTVRPGYSLLTALPGGSGPIIQIGDFWNSNGVHIQVVWTPTGLFQWNGASSTWTQITGPALTGSATQFFAWDIVGYKLAFSQGVNQILVWDGIAATYVLSSASAPAARYLAEINLHLMAGYTVESGTTFPSRYHWSGSGDPTDWTSFNSGINDELNNLGPITGLVKLGLYGFGFHINGIVEIVPTGLGTAPFAFYPIINASQGNVAPYSLEHVDLDGQECAVYLGYDNVYLFNGTSVIPIGDSPIDGRRRLGARTRIIADVLTAGPQNVYGFVTYSINGQFFKAYWLVIPGVSVWVYNFDEGNWTVFVYDQAINVLGNFNKAGVPRIMDLIGTISAQNWTPATLGATNPFQGLGIGFSSGQVGYIDFTNYSESMWQIISAKHTFGDRRHKHTIKKFRLVIKDTYGPIPYTITITNEKGQTQVQTVTLGSGSGDDIVAIVEFSLPGLRLQWQVTGPVQVGASFVEFAPIYDTSGEQRGGSADNN
jgi:hypothetical protein